MGASLGLSGPEGVLFPAWLFWFGLGRFALVFIFAVWVAWRFSSGVAKSFGGSTVTLLHWDAPLAVLVRHGLRVWAWQQGQRGNDLISVNGITVSILVRLRSSLEKNFQILFEYC
ncbi:hypothetical protein [Microvirga sp. BSC39]|uniref:hypothetical protein n=1 Tax=Microvirga sp. BSC39 TaxID=1549810 RepID=UPI00126A748E|nr:hypothetical protein [Microvirga sp. BSC39]